MDPTTSAVALVQALTPVVQKCVSAIKTLHEVQKKFKDAPQVAVAICAESNVIYLSLCRIAGLLRKQDATWSRRPSPGNFIEEGVDLAMTFDVALTGCMVMFSCLDEELRQIVPDGDVGQAGGIAWRSRARLLWNEKKLEGILASLRGQQTAIGLLIQMVQMDTLGDVKHILQRNQPVIEASVRATRSLRHKNPSVKVAASIYHSRGEKPLPRAPVAGGAHASTKASMVYPVSAVAPSDLEFAFDDIVLNSTAYRSFLGRCMTRNAPLPDVASRGSDASTMVFGHASRSQSAQAGSQIDDGAEDAEDASSVKSDDSWVTAKLPADPPGGENTHGERNGPGKPSNPSSNGSIRHQLQESSPSVGKEVTLQNAPMRISWGFDGIKENIRLKVFDEKPPSETKPTVKVPLGIDPGKEVTRVSPVSSHARTTTQPEKMYSIDEATHEVLKLFAAPSMLPKLLEDSTDDEKPPAKTEAALKLKKEDRLSPGLSQASTTSRPRVEKRAPPGVKTSVEMPSRGKTSEARNRQAPTSSGTTSHHRSDQENPSRSEARTETSSRDKAKTQKTRQAPTSSDTTSQHRSDQKSPTRSEGVEKSSGDKAKTQKPHHAPTSSSGTSQRPSDQKNPSRSEARVAKSSGDKTKTQKPHHAPTSSGTSQRPSDQKNPSRSEARVEKSSGDKAKAPKSHQAPAPSGAAGSSQVDASPSSRSKAKGIQIASADEAGRDKTRHSHAPSSKTSPEHQVDPKPSSASMSAGAQRAPADEPGKKKARHPQAPSSTTIPGHQADAKLSSGSQVVRAQRAPASEAGKNETTPSRSSKASPRVAEKQVPPVNKTAEAPRVPVKVLAMDEVKQMNSRHQLTPRTTSSQQLAPRTTSSHPPCSYDRHVRRKV